MTNDTVGRAVAPYGSWRSTISPEALVAGVVRLAEVRWDGDDLLWLEGRPDDGGRATLVRLRPVARPRTSARPASTFGPASTSTAEQRILAAGDVVVVSDFSTGRLLRVGPDRTATPITPDGPVPATPTSSWTRGRGRILAVREDHSGPGEASQHDRRDPARRLRGRRPGRASSSSSTGSDFVVVAAARPGWDAPGLAPLGPPEPALGRDRVRGRARGRAGHARPASGRRRRRGDVDCAAALGAGRKSLVVATEPGEWIGLHRWDGARLSPLTADVDRGGVRRPGLGLRLSPHSASPATGRIVAIGRADGRDRLWLLDPAGRRAATVVDLPFTRHHGPGSCLGGEAAAIVAAPTMFRTLVRIDLASGAWTAIRRSSELQLDPALVSVGEPVEFPTTGGLAAHGILYRPANPAFRAPDGELPPLVVTSHGGPTSDAFTGLSLTVQLLTSRGLAVLDVDYGGSTGYGKAYRKRLEGTWGVTDVDDCVAGAREMARRGEADGTRLAIEGGSASGFTTLAALAFRDVFRAGVSYFGIGNLEAFVAETHKFESRYLDRLIGPYPAARDLYRARSPIFHAEGFSCPVLVLQGLDDHVVPPAEAERIVAALAAKGIPHVYLPFEGEDHGFRQAPNIIRAAQAELAFYGGVFGFTPADDLPPLPWRSAGG